MSATAVIVDRWALVRLGVTSVLRGTGVRIVGEAEHARDAVLAVRQSAPSLLVIGLAADADMVEIVRQVKALDSPPAIIALVTQVDRSELDALLGLGTEGILLRSAAGDELAEVVTKVLAGERALGPAVLAVAAHGYTEAGLGTATTDGDGDELLTTKEREVLAMLAAGRANKDIADAMFITGSTVKTHLSHIYAKLGVGDRREAVARAVALGLLA